MNIRIFREQNPQLFLVQETSKQNQHVKKQDKTVWIGTQFAEPIERVHSMSCLLSKVSSEWRNEGSQIQR